MASAITKVYLDSRYSIDGKSFDLQNVGILLHPKSRCWLSEFTCVASWDTLDATNNKFVVTEGVVNRTITLPTGPHDIDSLSTAMQSALNTGKPATMGTYSVAKVGAASGTTFRSLQISVTGAVGFAVPSSQNTLSNIVNFPSSALATQHTSYFVDVRRVHSIYLHAPGLGSYGSVGPRGSRNILAKIPVLSGYGSLVHHQGSGSEHDFFEVGVSCLTTLTIELKDVLGNELNLNGTAWSCTLIFER